MNQIQNESEIQEDMVFVEIAPKNIIFTEQFCNLMSRSLFPINKTPHVYIAGEDAGDVLDEHINDFFKDFVSYDPFFKIY